MTALLSPEEFESWLRDGCGCHSLRVGDAVHAEYMRGIATARHYAKVAEALLSDDYAHAMHQHFWGGVDPRGHNRNPDGSPFGDCYKCGRLGDFAREYAAALATADEP
jgi:hypothetical protein